MLRLALFLVLRGALPDLIWLGTDALRAFGLPTELKNLICRLRRRLVNCFLLDGIPALLFRDADNGTWSARVTLASLLDNWTMGWLLPRMLSQLSLICLSPFHVRF